MLSTSSWISCGGSWVARLTMIATVKLINAPTAPKAVDLIPNSSGAASVKLFVSGMKSQPLCRKM